jgi:hypothetical protein
MEGEKGFTPCNYSEPGETDEVLQPQAPISLSHHVEARPSSHAHSGSDSSAGSDSIRRVLGTGTVVFSSKPFVPNQYSFTFYPPLTLQSGESVDISYTTIDGIPDANAVCRYTHFAAEEI